MKRTRKANWSSVTGRSPAKFLLNNSRAPCSSSGYKSLYYIRLRGFSIGSKRLKLPSKLLRFDNKGNGGTAIDSGTTFTVLNEEIYEKVITGFASQIRYRRAREVEAKTGVGLCYNISDTDNVLLPKFAFHFKGGSDMVLPIANYFTYFDSFDSICLTMVSSRTFNSEVDHGPAVVLETINNRISIYCTTERKIV